MYLRSLPALLLSCMLQPLAAGVSDARLPVIFIGAAYQDRLEQLRDMGSWKVVAKHSGMIIHPDNIKPGGSQFEVTKQVAPLFGIRQAVVERNRLPEAADVPWRIGIARETLGFTDGVYFYFNGITPSKSVTKNGILPPDLAWWERAGEAAKHGAVPLYGPAPHAVCRSPLGWKDKGWDHLRDLSIYKGYCLDAPAELYVRKGSDAASKTAAELYRESVALAIRHGRENRCRTIYLFSAHGTAVENIARSREVVRDLKRRDALPWAWAIEDYTRDSKIPMVPEADAEANPANTMTGLAYWILGFYAGRFE